MKSTAIIAIAVAAIIVVGGVGVALFLNNNNKDSTDYSNVNSKLMVRGNANGDFTVDSDDLDIVEKVIAGDLKKEDYPLADANNDGKVDDTDKQQVKDMIDKKDGMTMYVVCLGTDGKETTVQIKYPLRNVVVYATNMEMPCLFCNGGQYIAGYFTQSYATAEASFNKDAVNLEGSQRQITDGAWTNFTNLDASLVAKGSYVGAVLADYSGIAQFTESRMSDLNASGIPLISYTSADATDELTTVLTLGYLFGGDCEKMGLDYAKIGWDVKDKIKEKTESIENKKSYICGTMFIYICGKTSSFNTSATTAGGIAYAELNSAFDAKYTKNSTKMASTEALSNYTDAQIFINNRSMDWGLDADAKKALIIETWDHSNSGTSSRVYFSGWEDKLVYVNNLLPGAVKLAYMAHAMYGDLFDRAWADSILQDYIDLGTLPLQGQTLDTILAYIEFSDYKAAAGIE